MTVTHAQAQMLTSLAIACRPHRAPTWDKDGVMAMLERVRHLDLGEVIAATIRLAKDPHAHTPADIAKPASECWREQLKAPKWTPDCPPPEERCGVCSHQRHDGKCPRCAPVDDHAFTPDFKVERGPEVVEIVAALREAKRETADPAPATEPTTSEYHHQVQRLRSELVHVRTDTEESA